MADRQDSGSTNMKLDTIEGKLRWDLLDWDVIQELVEIMDHGARKHKPWDWLIGAPYSVYFAALCRHLFAWWGGQTLDPDSGKNHLCHVMACAMILVSYQKRMLGNDDR